MKTYYIYKLTTSNGEHIHFITNEKDRYLRGYQVPNTRWSELYGTYLITHQSATHKIGLEDCCVQNRQLRSNGYPLLSEEKIKENLRDYMQVIAKKNFYDDRILCDLLKVKTTKYIFNLDDFCGHEDAFVERVFAQSNDINVVKKVASMRMLFEGHALVGTLSVSSPFEQKYLDLLCESEDDAFLNYFNNAKNSTIIHNVTRKLSHVLPKSTIQEKLYQVNTKKVEDLAELSTWYQNQRNQAYVTQHRNRLFDTLTCKPFTRTQKDVVQQASERLQNMLTERKAQGKPLYSNAEYQALIKSNLLADAKALQCKRFDFSEILPDHIEGIMQWYDELPAFVQKHRHPLWDALTLKHYTATHTHVLKTAMDKIEMAIMQNDQISDKALDAFKGSKLFYDLQRQCKDRLSVALGRMTTLSEASEMTPLYPHVATLYRSSQ